MSNDSRQRATRLVQAIDDLFAFVNARPAIFPTEVRAFTPLDREVAVLARQCGLADALPQQGELAGRLPDSLAHRPAFPPPKFIGETNLPGDWMNDDDSFIHVPKGPWGDKMLTLRAHAVALVEAEVQPRGANIPGNQGEADQLEGSERKRRRGRKPDTNPKADKRVADAWRTRQYKTYEECSNALGLSEKHVKHALDRHRKRTSDNRRRAQAPE
jgi:hypothetical protein